MLTYRDVFRAPQFGPLFTAGALQGAASTTSGLALGVLVFTSTGSPLLSALSMFGSSSAQLVGATLLMSAADRLPPRAALTCSALAFGIGTAVLALPGLPLPAVFAVLLGLGALAAVAGGVRYGLLTEILPKEAFLLGRSVLNMCSGSVQVAGYAVGGALVAVLSARGTLLVAAGLYLAGAAVTRFGLVRRPPRVAGRPSVGATWRTNALLWSSAPRRRVYLALWVPNGLVVGCESLFVPYRPDGAGPLFACAALGMLAGDTLIGRFLPARHPASLLLQERLTALTPDAMTGQALGLHSSGMLSTQGVAAALAGSVAQQTSAGTAIALMALASVAVTLALAPGLRPEHRRLRQSPPPPSPPPLSPPPSPPPPESPP